MKVCFKRKRFFVQIRPDWVRILCTKKNHNRLLTKDKKLSLIYFMLLESLVLIALITVIMVILLLLINKIMHLDYSGLFNNKMIFFQNEWTDNVIGFHMPTYRACKTLWKTCVEYHTFYRLVLKLLTCVKIFCIFV